MYVVYVIPVGKQILKEELSYFSKNKYPIGSLVEIPVRNKKIWGIVHKISSVRNVKAELRNSSFELKQLKEGAKTALLFSEPFTQAAWQFSFYHAYALGPIFDAILPRKILGHIHKIPSPRIKEYKDNATPEKLVFQDDSDKRVEHYRALVRESFARRKSVYILVPTKSDSARLSHTLQKGIEKYFIDFGETMSEKELVEAYKKIREEPHPMLIIGTGKYISTERNDLGTIIIERESSRSYRELRRPYADYRIFAELYAGQIGARIIYADTMLRVETIGRLHRGELIEHAQLRRRLSLPPTIDLVDLRAKIIKESSDLPALSETMKEAVIKAEEQGEKIAIVSARKGLSPVTYCKDCGHMVLCPICGAGMILHAGKQENFFLCHKCGERKGADTVCAHCGSWNLEPYGAGIEKVEKELLELIPKKHLVRLDKDTTPTALAAKDKLKEWKDHGTVLLGTERMFSFLEEAHIRLHTAGIAGIDALFSIPDFRIYERIFSLITTIAGMTNERLIIDTRNPDHPLMHAVTRNDLMSFYREELALRKQLSYPPESVFIKISLSGKKELVAKEIEQVKSVIPDHELIIFPALTKKKHLYTMHALLKIPYNKWPDKELGQILSRLSPRFTVHVDPESLLS